MQKRKHVVIGLDSRYRNLKIPFLALEPPLDEKQIHPEESKLFHVKVKTGCRRALDTSLPHFIVFKTLIF